MGTASLATRVSKLEARTDSGGDEVRTILRWVDEATGETLGETVTHSRPAPKGQGCDFVRAYAGFDPRLV